ncbi:T7SS effector LXG polymorphic toxin [Listeria valentina]|uniref:T7SS effector LXG polymorphic toxin n=1 Tax=Listeria valentina TaxID=2705293 RepID=UPI0014312F1D|nr:T7SS effector LXG polymorphic toxin [Listeria valentina]
MPRISKSELSSAKEMTQKSRLEILNKFGKFETEVKEFEGTHKLKGKSWDSAKQHFGEYLPISDGIFNALADFGERFEQYLAAFESEVGSPKNKLDTADLEDLNDRLKTVKASKAQVLEMMKSKITQSYVAGGYSGSVGQSFDNAMEDINKDIQVLEDYRRFESSHANDFSAVSETWDHIDTYLDRLKKDGGYDASSNTYQSVDFSQEKFYKELSSYNASQKDHYEVQRIAVKTDHGYAYEYRMYKNGLYDPEATDKFNQLQKKAEMGQAVDFFKEVVGINDYIRMVDGIDPLTGKKITNNEQAVSSLMFLLTVVSEATALKVLKNMGKGNKALEGVKLTKEDSVAVKNSQRTAGDNASKYSTKIDSKVTELEKETLPSQISKSFTDSYYRTVETTEEVTVYRAFGGYADAGGGFTTTSPAQSRINAKIDAALLPEWKNTRMYEAEIVIPKGEKLNIGKVAPQTIPGVGTKLAGGADQILMPQDWPLNWISKISPIPN